MLAVEYSSLFKRDYKRCEKNHRSMGDLHKVIRLVAENSESSLEELHRHHDMHRLEGKWKGHYECHVANAGDWLVIWSSDGKTAFFERTGSHDALFR